VRDGVAYLDEPVRHENRYPGWPVFRHRLLDRPPPGTVRVLVVVQRLAQTGAVLVEFLMILADSWLACGWLLRRFGVASARRLLPWAQPLSYC
jgi:hypothetical protein